MGQVLGRVAALVALLACAGAAQAAIDLTITYTGDDVVSALYQDGASPVQVVLPDAGHRADWTVADSVAIGGLQHGDTYQFFFQVYNTGDASSSNHAGFLAEITGHAVGYPSDLFTSSSWDYVVDPFMGAEGNPPPTDGWASATEWVFSRMEGSLDSGDGFSSNTHGQIDGISGQASWIWGPHNGAELVGDNADENYLWLRATIRTGTPEPSTLLIWSLLALSGTGLSVWRRRRADRWIDGGVARAVWPDANRQAIRQIIARGMRR